MRSSSFPSVLPAVAAALNAGLSWRDIGSPVVIARNRPWTLVGGATYQIPEGWDEASLEAALERGSLEGFRGLVRLDTPMGADVLALADINADGELQRFSIGLGYESGDFRGFAIGSRNRDRDGPEANEYINGGTGAFESGAAVGSDRPVGRGVYHVGCRRLTGTGSPERGPPFSMPASGQDWATASSSPLEIHEDPAH